MSEAYRRRVSVRKGAGVQHRAPDVLDGGRDAPLDEASNRMFKHVAITIAAVGTAMVVAAVLGY